jgi:MULE transposase domain
VPYFNILAVSYQVGQKILLGVAWCREDERILFEKHPEVFMFDCTHQTNSERRPLGIGAGVDQNMEIFTPFCVFMPSQQQWVFDWIFRCCIPTLMGPGILERTQLVLTDGDKQMYGAFDNVQEAFYPNAKHGLCMYHLVNKGIERVQCRLRRQDKTRVNDLVHTFKTSIFTWFQLGGVETIEEFAVSRKALNDWLKNLQLDGEEDEDVRHNSGVLHEFLLRCILPHKNRFLVCLRVGSRTLDYRANSALEGVNQTLKRKSGNKVTPNMSLKKSLKTQDLQQKARMDRHRRRTLKHSIAKKKWARLSPTARWVTKICESQIQQNVEESDKYFVLPSGGYEVLMLRMPDEGGGLFCELCTENSTCSSCSYFSPVVKFRRVRKLTFTEVYSDSGVHIGYEVECSCPYYATFGIPCRHFCVLAQVSGTSLVLNSVTSWSTLF